MSFITLEFLLPAILTCFVLSLLTSIFGIFIINKKTSLMGESISHALIPGVGLGVLFGGLHFSSVFFGALVFLLLYSFFFMYFRRKFSQVEDSLLAVFQVGMLSLGTLLITHFDVNINLSHLLMGNIFAISREDFIWIACLATLLLIAFFWLRPRLMVYLFDPEFYQALGNSDALMRLFFDLSLGVILILSLQSLGALLSLGLLIIPSLMALQLFSSFRAISLFAFTISFLSCLLGLAISAVTSWPVGPAIMALLFFQFLLVSFFTQSKRL